MPAGRRDSQRWDTLRREAVCSAVRRGEAARPLERAARCVPVLVARLRPAAARGLAAPLAGFLCKAGWAGGQLVLPRDSPLYTRT